MNAAHPDHLIVRRKYFGIVGPKCKPRPPRFTPWPKSLVWPTPLVFACCIFVTGLTRESVRLLVAPPEGGGAICVVLPVSILLVLSALFCVTVGEVVVFHRRHNTEVTSPRATEAQAETTGDPYMRAAAKLLAAVRRLCAGQGRRVAPSESNAPTGANDLGFSDRKAGGFSAHGGCESPDARNGSSRRRSRSATSERATCSRQWRGSFSSVSTHPAVWVWATGSSSSVATCYLARSRACGRCCTRGRRGAACKRSSSARCSSACRSSALCGSPTPIASSAPSRAPRSCLRASRRRSYLGRHSVRRGGHGGARDGVCPLDRRHARAYPQLLEQRLVTPTVNVVSRKGCDPFALMAAAWILLVSLRHCS